jgi:antitoxin VapB
MSDSRPSARNVRPFRDGANRDVRIPCEFELPGEALMRCEDEKLEIEPVYPSFQKGTLAALAGILATMETLEEDFPDVDEGLTALDHD